MLVAGGLALTSVRPVSAQELKQVFDPPLIGTFYLLSQQSGESQSPPYPFDPYVGTMPIYEMKGLPGAFVVADSQKDYLALQELNAGSFSSQSALMSAMDAEGGGGIARMSCTSSDLWIELDAASLTNGTGTLVIHPPDTQTNAVWDLWSALTLTVEPGAIGADNWMWVGRTDPGQTNFTAPLLSETASFYRAAAPDNDVDGDGMPDTWMWQHFGHVTGWASDLTRAADDYDSDGISNLGEFLGESDPDDVLFATSVTNQDVNQSQAPVQLEVLAGMPFNIAVLVDDTNFATAQWTSYTSSNVTVNLGGTEGWHEVWVGLRGRAVESLATWEWLRLRLDVTPPTIVITNPVAPTLSQSLAQVQGFCVEAVASLRYDLSNSMGVVTNEYALVTDTVFDPIDWIASTNFFQCYDMVLAEGTNVVTLRAADLAGNVTSTNFTFAVLGDSDAPDLTLTWPQDGCEVGANTIAVKGIMNDPSATLSLTLESDGLTNTYDGLVARDGRFWVENLPMSPGTNRFTLTATDVWGNATTTNLSVVRSTVTLTLDPIPPDDLWRPALNLSGTVSDSSYSVWVNGVEASVSNGIWQAENVLVTPGGTARFGLRAYAPGEEIPGQSGGN